MPQYDFRCSLGHKFSKTFDHNYEPGWTINPEFKQFELEQVCTCGSRARRAISAPMFVVDQTGYTCPITDKWIGSKHQHNENLKLHSCRVYEQGETAATVQRREQEDAELDRKIEDTVEREISSWDSDKREQLHNELVNQGLDIVVEKEIIMPPAKDELETQPDFDTDSAVADISSDLFGQGSDEEEGEEEKAGGQEDQDSDDPSVDAPETPAQPEEEPKESDEAEVPEENSEEVQAVGAPQTWTKEAIQEWASIPERAQQEILKREEDMFRGLEQYKGWADVGQQYSNVVSPYAPVLAAEGIDPVQLFQSFAANHYLLTRGTPQQKVELAATMLMGYDIPLPDLLNYIADQDMPMEPVDPVVQTLQREVGELRNVIATAQNTAFQNNNAVIDAEIEAFATDPAHPYFNELANDIQKLFETGMAQTLPEAYDKALFMNSEIRQKEIDRLTAEKLSTANTEQTARKEKIAKSTAADVVLTPKNRDGTIPTGSIDDTLEETYAAIEARG